MAKRGRPSKKVMKKRKKAKAKSKLMLFIAVLILAALLVACYYTLGFNI